MRCGLLALIPFMVLVATTYSQAQGDQWNEISTSVFPIEVAYERYLSENDSLGLELDYPLLLDNWYYGSAVTRFLLEYKRYFFGKGAGFYLAINSGIGSEVKYSSPGQKWRGLSFISWVLTGVYLGGDALNTNRYQVDYIPVNIGLGWKLFLRGKPIDLRVTVGYSMITGYRDDVGLKVRRLSDLPYKTDAYLTNQYANLLFSPSLGFSF